MLSASSCSRWLSGAAEVRSASAGANTSSARSRTGAKACMGHCQIAELSDGSTGGGGALHAPIAGEMQTALFLLCLLPPPAPSALGLARPQSARAGRAADGQKAAIVQRVVRHSVRA